LVLSCSIWLVLSLAVLMNSHATFGNAAQFGLLDDSLPGGLVPQGAILSDSERDFVMKAFWHGRELLRSAIFDAEVVVSVVDFDERKEQQRLTYFVCFDNTGRRIRLDYENGERKWEVVRTPTATLVHEGSSGVIERRAPDEPYQWPEIQCVDVRVIGVANKNEIGQGYPGDALQTSMSFLSGDVKPVVVRNSQGLYVATWNFTRTLAGGHQFNLFRRIWIDEDLDYSPVRLEEIEWLDDRMPEGPQTVCTVEYESVNDTWVPGSCVFVTRDEAGVADDSCTTTESSWAFHWDSANENVDDVLFTAEGLDAPGGTLVVNKMRGDDTIVERVIPRDGVDDLPGGPTRLLNGEKLGGRVGWGRTFLVANVTIVIVLVVLLVIRRLRTS
jgi:hypothetical protein